MAEVQNEVLPADRQEDAYAFEEESPIDLNRAFQRLRAGRKTILQFTGAAFILAAVTAYVIPPKYTSTASFIPPGTIGSGSALAASVAGQLSTLGASDLLNPKGPGDLYVGILKSRSIAEVLIRRFGLMRVYKTEKVSVAEKRLGSDTTIAADAKSGIVTLSVMARTPQLAHDLTAAYMEALHDTNGRLALSQASQRRLFFGQQLEHEKDDLENAEVDLKETEEQTGLIAPAGQTEAEIRTLSGMQAQIAARQVQLAALRQSATEENPEIIRLKSEIQDLDAQLARMQSGGGKRSPTAIPTSKVPELGLEYVRKEREVKYHEALFEMLSRQYEAARLDESREAPLLQVLDPASFPDRKSSPHRLYYMLGGLAGGFLGGYIWVLMRENARNAAVSTNDAA